MDTQTLITTLYIILAAFTVVLAVGLIHSASPLVRTLWLNARHALAIQCFYWRYENLPQMVIGNEIIARATKGTFAYGISNIYVGHCRDNLPRGTDEGAHAHVDGTKDICMFIVQGETRTEWILAHELAHLIASAKFATHCHDKPWKNVMFALGYREDAERYTGEKPSELDVSLYQTRNPVIARLAAVIDAEIDRRRPGIALWRLRKVAAWITHPAAAAHTQNS